MAEGGTGRAARALTSGPRRSVGAGSARCGVQRGWAERDAARGGAGLVEALRPGPDRAEPRRLGPAEERASWAEVGPREGRGRPGPRWAGPGLLGFGSLGRAGFLFNWFFFLFLSF